MTTTLRTAVLAESGQDIHRCRGCNFCDRHIMPEQDLSFSMVMQLILDNDDEVLTARTVWSETVENAAEHACAMALDVPAILRALRAEAHRRGLTPEIP